MGIAVSERGLSVVAEARIVPVQAETISERVLRLQSEAQGLAREHVGALQAALVATERLAAEIAAGGEAYPVGVREIARRLTEDCAQRAQTIAVLLGRL